MKVLLELLGGICTLFMPVLLIAAFFYVIYQDIQEDGRIEAIRRQRIEDAKARGLIREVTPGLWAITDPITGATCYASRDWFGASLKNCVKS